MKREILYTLPSPFRDDFRIRGFRFGEGRKSLAIVGPMRGDEVQQQFIAARLVAELRRIEEAGNLVGGHEILVIPSANPFSMNIESRFWAMDGTDINRMFPGYALGETTQRVADGIFSQLKGYAYGIQLASYYIAGDFVPHVRMLHTGYQDERAARLFGLPYVCVRKPLPYDTTLLNYNWQIWDTKAYSLYAGRTSVIDDESSVLIVRAILRFIAANGWIRHRDTRSGFSSEIIQEEELLTVKTPVAGLFERLRPVNSDVSRGDVLARILDPYDGSVIHQVTSPVDGVIFFAHNKSLARQNTPLFKVCNTDPSSL